MTINEIAKEAGVSIATVSRFLNNGPVKEETKKKLEEIILKMNYVPSTFAKEIISTQTSSIAILTHSLSNMYTTEFIEEITDRYNDKKMQCFTGCCTDAESEYRYLMDVTSKKYSGVILHEPAEGQAQLELYSRLSARLPLVMIHSYPADINCNSISVDQNKGMKQAMTYLIQTGHKRIAYVAGKTGYSFLLKESIWKEEMQKAGLEYYPQDSIKTEGSDFDKGIQITKDEILKYFEAGNRPDAIFTANDIMAMGTIAALNDLGLSVGKDISLMSHDNTVIAQTLNLTCVDMKIKSVAIAAMDLLEYAIHGEDKTPRHITITPEIIIRSSVIESK